MDNRGQADIALLLAVAGAIIIATIAGLILKGVFTSVQPDVQSGTNAVVHSLA
ncbi:MAG: hypothetical protein AABY11_03605 [archaeon]